MFRLAGADRLNGLAATYCHGFSAALPERSLGFLPLPHPGRGLVPIVLRANVQTMSTVGVA
jgi:hypothetical protein